MSMVKRLEIKEGQRFSRLRVLHEECSRRNAGGSMYRVFKVQCDCGKQVSVALGSLRSGHTRSCGCKRAKHKEVHTRLYRCWKSMKLRARNRSECSVHEPWLDFLTFKKWANASGYSDSLILCRNQDKGDYCPENARWDTQASNRVEAFAKSYYVTFPESKEEVLIYNLAEFCRENNLDSSAMSKVLRGKNRHHKGYTIRRKIDESQ